MKIFPDDYVLRTLGEVTEGFKMTPSVGDDGHVDDHRALSETMFGIPLNTIQLGFAAKGPDGEGWMLAIGGNPDTLESEPSTWEEVSNWANQVGVAAVAGSPHPAADGVTDYAEDSADLNGLSMYLFPAGVVGLTYAVRELQHRMRDLEAAQA